MDSQILISIGIPTYNSESYIIETLESVRSQEHKNIELVIVDDRSTDQTFDIVEKWLLSSGLTYFLGRNDRNLGVVGTCNAIVNRVRGDYYQILGADDIIYPHKLKNQLDLFNRQSEQCAMVFSNVDVIDDIGNIICDDYFAERNYDAFSMPSGQIFVDLLRENFIPAVGVLVKTSIAKKFMPYDETLAFEDYDLWLKLAKDHLIVHCPIKAGAYRRRAGSIMHQTKSRYEVMASTLFCLTKYEGISEVGDDLIASKIYNLTPALYRFKHRSAKHWVKEMWLRRKTVKSTVYLIISILGIPLRMLK